MAVVANDDDERCMTLTNIRGVTVLSGGIYGPTLLKSD